MSTGNPIWFFDECSTSLWERRGRVWQPKGDNQVVAVPPTRGSGVTILGALTKGRLVCSLGNATDTDNVITFFEHLASVADL